MFPFLHCFPEEDLSIFPLLFILRTSDWWLLFYFYIVLNPLLTRHLTFS